MPVHSDINISHILTDWNFCWNMRQAIATHLQSLITEDYKDMFVCPDVGGLDLKIKFILYIITINFKKVLVSQDPLIFLSCMVILFNFYCFLIRNMSQLVGTGEHIDKVW